MPRQWVVNASPLIILGKIGRLSFLTQLAESLVVPAGVAYELAAGPENDPARQWIAGPGKDHVRDVGNVDPFVAGWDLGRGESHVLTWALRHPGSEVLLDDFAARKCAAALSIVPMCWRHSITLPARIGNRSDRCLVSLDRPRRAGLWCGGLSMNLPQEPGRRSRGDSRYPAAPIRPLATLSVARGRCVYWARVGMGSLGARPAATNPGAA
jgi:predicted nucleic acid-binding protein